MVAVAGRRPATSIRSEPVRFLRPTTRQEPERLLWSRDLRFARRLAADLPNAHALELDSGIVVIAPASELTDVVALRASRDAREAEYGLVSMDPNAPERDRYLLALSQAVQQSGIADRIGMGVSAQVAQTKLLDYFFGRSSHGVEFQPIVELATGVLLEYECLFRPDLPGMPTLIGSLVQAAIDTGRSVDLDLYIVQRVLLEAGELSSRRIAAGGAPLRIAINLTPASLLDPQFEARELAAAVRAAGLTPRQITLECTEQQAVSDVLPLQRQVKALRRLGFGFAVDDAGAGYASFSLIAALRPSIIKIDREIVHKIATDDAKQALVEAFVSFGRRIHARLLAEGIETRRDLAMLLSLGVDLGQGYLLGKPTPEPRTPRRIDAVLSPSRTSTHPHALPESA